MKATLDDPMTKLKNNSQSTTWHLPTLGAMHRKTSKLTAIALGTLMTAAAAPAMASGISVARFGGAHGNPTETNAYSIYYNPAGLAGVNGYQLSLDVNWAQRNATYERPVSAIDDLDNQSDEAQAANSGEGSVSNFIYSPMLGFATDFNGAPISIGFGFFAPFGGQSVWDEVDGDPNFAGSTDGAQRWYVIEGTIRTLAFSLGVAHEIEAARLSIGLSGNLYLNEVNTVRARTATGTDSLEAEGRSLLDVTNTAFGIGAGVLWEPIEDELFVGLSYQSAPGFDGELVYEGSLTNIFPPNDGEPTDIVLTSQLPDIIRLGARWRMNRETSTDGTPDPKMELRLFGDLTRWSKMSEQCVIDPEFLGSEDPYEFCAVNEDGSLVTEGNAVVQNLRRQWTDAAGFRLGASYWVNNNVELIVDVGYDGNAVPDETLEPALQDYSKVTAGIGGRFQLAPSVAFGLLATNVFYMERDTTDVGTQEDSPPPSRQPSSEGVYNQNVFLVNTNFDFTF